VVAAFYRAAATYVMRPYAGRVTLFAARDAVRRPGMPPDLGWGRWAQGGVDIQPVPGTHLSMIEEPHAQVVAARLCACLRDFACRDVGIAREELP
jgi:aspartate racemase